MLLWSCPHGTRPALCRGPGSRGSTRGQQPRGHKHREGGRWEPASRRPAMGDRSRQRTAPEGPTRPVTSRAGQGSRAARGLQAAASVGTRGSVALRPGDGIRTRRFGALPRPDSLPRLLSSTHRPPAAARITHLTPATFQKVPLRSTLVRPQWTHEQPHDSQSPWDLSYLICKTDRAGLSSLSVGAGPGGASPPDSTCPTLLARPHTDPQDCHTVTATTLSPPPHCHRCHTVTVTTVTAATLLPL